MGASCVPRTRFEIPRWTVPLLSPGADVAGLGFVPKQVNWALPAVLLMRARMEKNRVMLLAGQLPAAAAAVTGVVMPVALLPWPSPVAVQRHWIRVVPPSTVGVKCVL